MDSASAGQEGKWTNISPQEVIGTRMFEETCKCGPSVMWFSRLDHGNMSRTGYDAAAQFYSVATNTIARKKITWVPIAFSLHHNPKLKCL